MLGRYVVYGEHRSGKVIYFQGPMEQEGYVLSEVVETLERSSICLSTQTLEQHPKLMMCGRSEGSIRGVIIG